MVEEEVVVEEEVEVEEEEAKGGGVKVGWVWGWRRCVRVVIPYSDVEVASASSKSRSRNGEEAILPPVMGWGENGSCVCWLDGSSCVSVYCCHCFKFTMDQVDRAISMNKRWEEVLSPAKTMGRSESEATSLKASLMASDAWSPDSAWETTRSPSMQTA